MLRLVTKRNIDKTRTLIPLVLVLFLCLLFSLRVYGESSQLVVVVAIDNPVNSLSKKEVVDIYMGRYKTFPDSRYAQAIDYPSGSEIKQQFYQLLVDRSERKINAYWSRLLFSGRATPPKSTNSSEEVVAELINNPNGLAYMPEHAVTQEMKIVYRL